MGSCGSKEEEMNSEIDLSNNPNAQFPQSDTVLKLKEQIMIDNSNRQATTETQNNLAQKNVYKAVNDNLYSFGFPEVKPATTQPKRQITATKILQDVIGIKEKLEDFSHSGDGDAHFVSDHLPGFIQAIHTAYQSHYPLKLSVSDFTITIGQGISRHINENSEKLQNKFVSHEGKEVIVIRRDEFKKGAQNDWSTVFEEFAEQIRKRVKTDIYDVIIDDSSVATKESRIVSEITLMDSIKNYFGYEVLTECGIPKITLEGSKEDWEGLRNKVRKLKEMNKDDCLDLGWWLDHLIPVINQVCDTAVYRKDNLAFWNNIYKHSSFGSGNPRVSGWITKLFPYKTHKRNEFGENSTIGTNRLPHAFSKVPFIWSYYGEKIDMNFYGGFLGAEYNKDDNSIKPALFWCVAYEDKNKGKGQFIAVEARYEDE